MLKIKIYHKKEKLSYGAEFETKVKLDTWLEKAHHKKGRTEETGWIFEITDISFEAELRECHKARKKAYGDMGSQLDEVFHNGIDSWKARIQKVKEDIPKPTE